MPPRTLWLLALVGGTLACAPAPTAPPSATTAASRVLHGEVHVTGPADLARLHGVTHVEGTLTLTGLSRDVTLPDVTHLGALVVQDAPGLTALSLPALTEVDAGLTLHDLPALESVRLDALRHTGAPLQADRLPRLEVLAAPRAAGLHGLDLHALSALHQLELTAWTDAPGDLRLRELPALHTLALPALQTLSGELTLEHARIDTLLAPSLHTVHEPLTLRHLDLAHLTLPALTHLTDLHAEGLTALTRVSLPALTGILGTFTLEQSPDLQVLHLPNLAELGDGLFLVASGPAEGLTLPALLRASRLEILDLQQPMGPVRLPATWKAGRLVFDPEGTGPVLAKVELPALEKVQTILGRLDGLEAPMLGSASCLRIDTTGPGAPLVFPALEAARSVWLTSDAGRDISLPSLHWWNRLELSTQPEGLPHGYGGEIHLHGFTPPLTPSGIPFRAGLAWQPTPEDVCPKARSHNGPTIVHSAEHLAVGPGVLPDTNMPFALNPLDRPGPEVLDLTLDYDEAIFHALPLSLRGVRPRSRGALTLRGITTTHHLTLIAEGPISAPDLQQVDQLTVLTPQTASFVELTEVTERLGVIRAGALYAPNLETAQRIAFWPPGSDPAHDSLRAQIDAPLQPSTSTLHVPALTALSELVIDSHDQLTALDLPILEVLDLLHLTDLAGLHTVEAPALQHLGTAYLEHTPAFDDPAPAALDLRLPSLGTADTLYLSADAALGALQLPALAFLTGELTVTPEADVSLVELPSLVTAHHLRLQSPDLTLTAPSLTHADRLELGDQLDVFGQAVATPSAPTGTLSLPALSSVGYLRIAHLGPVGAVDLPALTTATERLQIEDLPSLHTLSLPALSTTPDPVWLNLLDLPALAQLDLSSATHLGRLALVRTGLTELHVPGLHTLGDHLTAYDNPALQFLTLPDLSAAAQVYLDGNPSLEIVDLPALTTTDALTVWDHPDLRTLALPSLAQITTEARVEDVPILDTLTLAPSGTTGELRVENAPSLDACAFEDSLIPWDIGYLALVSLGPCLP